MQTGTSVRVRRRPAVIGSLFAGGSGSISRTSPKQVEMHLLLAMPGTGHSTERVPLGVRSLHTLGSAAEADVASPLSHSLLASGIVGLCR